MESITLSRLVEAPPEEVAELVGDVETFMRAAEFDDATVEGDRLRIRNGVGLATVELDCELVERDCALAYEQRDGIFKAMETRYELLEREGGTEVRATTEFVVDVALVGEILDATVIKRQRRKELEAQFDYLERQVDDT